MFVSLKLKFPKSSSVETLKNFASFNSASCRGTTPSLVEAMNLSIPIFAFDCVYNRATTEEKCLYWKIAEDLQNLMKNKSGKFAEIAREMGETGKRLYSWERIARQYNALYQ